MNFSTKRARRDRRIYHCRSDDWSWREIADEFDITRAEAERAYKCHLMRMKGRGIKVYTDRDLEEVRLKITYMYAPLLAGLMPETLANRAWL